MIGVLVVTVTASLSSRRDQCLTDTSELFNLVNYIYSYRMISLLLKRVIKIIHVTQSISAEVCSVQFVAFL